MSTVDRKNTRTEWPPTQNVQMIAVERRPVPAINVVTRSGATTQVQNIEKRPDEARVCKTPEKIPAFDVNREKETFMEARKDFAGPPVAVSQQLHQPSQLQEASPDQVSALTSFLQSCMKLLRNKTALNELQKVLQSCESQRNPDKGKNVNRVRRTGRKMRLHAQIGEYDMTDIILDMGSEVNVLTRKNWE